jgi:hypothetical protein
VIWIKDFFPNKYYVIQVWRKGKTEPELFKREFQAGVQKEFVIQNVKKELIYNNWILSDPKEYVNGYRIFDLIEL